MTVLKEAGPLFEVLGDLSPAGHRGIEVLARRLGSALDPTLIVHDAKTGSEVPSLYRDDSPGCQTDARLTHVFKDAGDFVIEVRDSTHRGGGDFWYRLRVGDFPSAITPMPLANGSSPAGPGLQETAAAEKQIAAAAASRSQPAALATRALPACLFRRLRTAAVLPWMRVTLARGMVRRAFFFCVSMARGDRLVMTVLVGLAGTRRSGAGWRFL